MNEQATEAGETVLPMGNLVSEIDYLLEHIEEAKKTDVHRKFLDAFLVEYAWSGCVRQACDFSRVK